MISIEMTGMCDGCFCADLELQSAETYMGERLWAIKCIHQDACEEMKRKTIAEEKTEHQT